MTAQFSGIVRISNVSDFIEPSQKCILPIENGEQRRGTRASLVTLHAKTPTTPAAEKRVKVSLNDCLACSGCVTTAETILIESQTTEQMLSGIRLQKYSVVAISPQALCSLAAKFDLTPSEMARVASQYFKSLGADFIVDTSFARLESRKKCFEEFAREFVDPLQEECSRSTILSSVCPGFVCYAEKTHGDLLVPLLSRVRSPQAVMGRLVKDYLGRRLSTTPEQIFLVSVQPCFDKKLEASRPDFALGDRQEVDCVVTPVEMEPLLAEFIQRGEASGSFVEEEKGGLLPDTQWFHSLERGVVLGERDTETSGGYAEYIARRLVEGHGGVVAKRERIAQDFELITVEFEKGEQRRTITLAKAYGFRNIQNLVQRLKRNKLKAHFVEVMACPSGCSNGGGQIRAEKADRRAQLTERVRANYAELGSNGGREEEEWGRIEEEWAGDEPNWSESALHTNFKPIKATIQTHSTFSW